MNTEQNVEQELQAMNSPLARRSKEMPYVVPEYYFPGLAESALQLVKLNAVPEGYFQALPAAMLEAAKTSDVAFASIKPKSKIIALPAVRWAAAAVLIIAVAIGGGRLYQRAQSPERAIAALPTDAMEFYAEVNLADETIATVEAPDLTGLTAEELEAYLADNGWVE